MNSFHGVGVRGDERHIKRDYFRSIDAVDESLSAASRRDSALNGDGSVSCEGRVQAGARRGDEPGNAGKGGAARVNQQRSTQTTD